MRFYILKGSFSNNSEEELRLYNIALKLAVENQNKKLEEIALISIGTFYAIHENFALAEKHLKNALYLAHKRNANTTLSSLYNNLAGIGLADQKTEIYIDSAIYFAEKSKNLNDLQTALQNKAYYLQNKNKFKEGYDVLWESIAVKDSLFNRDKVKSFADMEQKYESEIKNIEIAYLQRESEIAKLKASRSLGINFGLGGAMVGLIFVSFAFYTQNKKKQKLNNELTKEKNKSDKLLLNILPEEIADELKASGKSEAKLYNQVSVLFTDFVNFTGLSEQMSPTQLVQEIHQNFTAFDAIMEKHGIEKIKTIGDAYLAVCGLPHENTNHAEQIVLAALDIQQFMEKNMGKFQIRIGIHSGPVVAGIVGVKKYAYDIWGDTVNTASRMEGNSEPGKINISGDTYQLIQEKFNCTYRGKINAKNKGDIDMYFVNNSL
jgi:class 3 adenylate cyclase